MIIEYWMKKIPANPLPVALVAMLFAFTSCTFVKEKTIQGDGEIISETILVDQFSELFVAGMFELVLVKGEEPKVVLEVDQNLREHIFIHHKGSKLVVDKGRGVALNPTRMKLEITHTGLEKVDLSGAASVVGNHTIEGRRFELSISGAASIDLDLLVGELHLNLAGAGNIKLEGEADKFFCKLSGAGNLEAPNLVTRSTEISLSGACSAEVHATNTLIVTLGGIGSITYHGDPPSTTINKSGLGKIKRAN